jgi:hypothetical protein
MKVEFSKASTKKYRIKILIKPDSKDPSADSLFGSQLKYEIIACGLPRVLLLIKLQTYIVSNFYTMILDSNVLELKSICHLP